MVDPNSRFNQFPMANKLNPHRHLWYPWDGRELLRVDESSSKTKVPNVSRIYYSESLDPTDDGCRGAFKKDSSKALRIVREYNFKLASPSG